MKKCSHFISLFAGIVVGAMIVGYSANAQPNQQRQNNCGCCQHMIQLAEDVHFIRSKYKFDFTPPPDINPKNPGTIEIKPIKEHDFDATPEIPKRRR